MRPCQSGLRTSWKPRCTYQSTPCRSHATRRVHFHCVCSFFLTTSNQFFLCISRALDCSEPSILRRDVSVVRSAQAQREVQLTSILWHKRVRWARDVHLIHRFSWRGAGGDPSMRGRQRSVSCMVRPSANANYSLDAPPVPHHAVALGRAGAPSLARIYPFGQASCSLRHCHRVRGARLTCPLLENIFKKLRDVVLTTALGATSF